MEGRQCCQLQQPLTYCVDIGDNYLKTFRGAYSGTDCSCTVSNLEAGNSYTFYLHVKICELMSGAICEVLCDVVSRHFGPNGMLYCGGLLDRCNCGKCKSYVCGEGNGCQCTDCMNCQTTFYRANPCTCLNNHPYRLGTCRDVDTYCEVLFCSVCRKIIYSEGPQAFFYMLMCENCLSFVCPACILRVMYPREKVLDGAVIPRFPS